MPGILGFNVGAQSQKGTQTTSIDALLRGLQEGNYYGAQQIPGAYDPTSAAQIQGYENPYVSNVVDTSLADLDRSRQMAVNSVSDAADKAGAFGGSRHGVAEALTNTGYGQQAGMLSAQLHDQAYQQALAAAQNENQFRFLYPLQRQQTLNQTLAGITPTTTVNSKGSTLGFGVSGGIGTPKGG